MQATEKKKKSVCSAKSSCRMQLIKKKKKVNVLCEIVESVFSLNSIFTIDFQTTDVLRNTSTAAAKIC